MRIDRHYLFGDNSCNQCLGGDNKSIVNTPYRIDKIIENKTKAKIHSVYLGISYTMFLVKRENEALEYEDGDDESFGDNSGDELTINAFAN